MDAVRLFLTWFFGNKKQTVGISPEPAREAPPGVLTRERRQLLDEVYRQKQAERQKHAELGVPR